MGDYTGAYTVIFRLQECNGWGEGRGILYFKASVVQWKDIRPWQRDLFLKISVYTSSEGSAKQRWVGRVAQLGCSVAQKGAE